MLAGCRPAFARIPSVDRAGFTRRVGDARNVMRRARDVSRPLIAKARGRPRRPQVRPPLTRISAPVIAAAASLARNRAASATSLGSTARLRAARAR